MRETKFQVNWYQASDTAAIEQKLEKMAEKGWRLETLNNQGFRYRRSQPEKARYSVTFFPEASIFDSAPTEGQQTYADYCAAAGWEPVGNWGPLQIFRSTRENPTPIETDEREKLDAIHKSMLKTQILSYGLLLAVWSLNLAQRIGYIKRHPLTIFSDSPALGYVAFIACAIGYTIYILTDHFVWYLRSKKAVERGEGCLPTNAKLRFWLSMVLLALCAGMVTLTAADAVNSDQIRMLTVSMVGMALILAVSQFILATMKKKGFSRDTNRGVFIAAAVILGILYAACITAVAMRTVALKPEAQTKETYIDAQGHRRTIYSDPLPVALEDLGYTVTEEDHTSSRSTVSRSPLMLDEECVHSVYGAGSLLPELDYRIAKSKYPWVLKLCWKYLLDTESGTSGFEPADVAQWGAEDAFFHRAPDGLCLLYGDRIIIVNTWDQLSPAEQTALLEGLRRY